MADYKNLKINPDTFDTLQSDKPDGVTWDHYLKNLYRNAKAYERGENE